MSVSYGKLNLFAPTDIFGLISCLWHQSVLLHPEEEKALSLPSDVLISLAEVQSAPALKFATI